MYYSSLSPNYKATQWYMGKNRSHCAWWWASVIDYYVLRRQGLMAVKPASTPSGDCPRTNHTMNWCIHARFHDAFWEHWSSLKWCLWRGRDPHSLIGRWCCRKATLDRPIADSDPGVLVWVGRWRDVAHWEWGDILPLEGSFSSLWAYLMNLGSEVKGTTLYGWDMSRWARNYLTL